jgi:hypothetical protein
MVYEHGGDLYVVIRHHGAAVTNLVDVNERHKRHPALV